MTDTTNNDNASHDGHGGRLTRDVMPMATLSEFVVEEYCKANEVFQRNKRSDLHADELHAAMAVGRMQMLGFLSNKFGISIPREVTMTNSEPSA